VQESAEPRACPAPEKDRPGADRSSRAQDYEDRVKQRVNPENPTPRGFAVKLPLATAKTGAVFFDDCQHTTGDMIDAKGPGFWRVIEQAKRYKFEASFDNDLLTRALNQVQAANKRRIRWYIEEPETSKYMRDLFVEIDKGRERIEIVVFR